MAGQRHPRWQARNNPQGESADVPSRSSQATGRRGTLGSTARLSSAAQFRPDGDGDRGDIAHQALFHAHGAWVDRWDDESTAQPGRRGIRTDSWSSEASGNWPVLTPPHQAVRRRQAHLWQVSLLVTACVVVVATLGATLLRWQLTATSTRAPSRIAHQPAPPVITLFSPSGTSDAHSPAGNAAGPTQPLPNTTAVAPTQYLAPDKPNAYELSLIAAVGTPEKTIVVSRLSQTIHVYLNGSFIAGSYAITGRPELPTPTGVYHIYLKVAPAVLYSPWPPGSPYYYPPAPVNYTMEFRAGGFLIHDAPWHHVWGPGMNDWHFDPVANEWQWGTHGCVAAPTPFIQWLYNWSPDGTTIIIY